VSSAASVECRPVVETCLCPPLCALRRGAFATETPEAREGGWCNTR